MKNITPSERLANNKKRKEMVSTSTPKLGFRVGVLTHIQSEWEVINGKKRNYSNALSKIFHHDPNSTWELTCSYQREFKHLSVHHGEKYAIKRMKVYLSCAERFASHVKFTPPEYTCLDGDRVPKFLWKYKPLLRNKYPWKRQLALTILSLGRVYECGVETYDVSSITKTHPLNNFKSQYVGHFFMNSQCDGLDVRRLGLSWRKVIKSLFPANKIHMRIKELEGLNALHVSGRNGPNGHSLSGAYRDMIALLLDEGMGGSLLDDIKDLAELTGFESLLDHLESFPTDKKFLRLMRKEIDEGITHFHSVISLKRGEPWWKERIFASIDFFSQSSLLPIQKWFNRFFDTAMLACDGSKDQSKVIEKCREWTEKLFPYSKDLTTATDSIPIQLLTEIIMAVFGSEIGGAWQGVMSNRSFYDKVNDCFVKYITGNPMGAYTSWHLLHVFQVLLYLTIEDYLNLPASLTWNSTNFVVVGDDSATCNKEISKIYDIIMSQILDVSQSPLKGYNPDVSELESFKVCEMCKRILVNGVDISPISPRVILDGIRDSSLFPNMMLHIKERCLFITDIDKVSASLLVNTDQPLKTLKVITNPLICPVGFNPDWFDRSDMKEYVEFINSIEYNQFHAHFLAHGAHEIHMKKIEMQEWIGHAYVDMFCPPFGPFSLPSSLTNIHFDAQFSLCEQVLGQVTDMVTGMDDLIFPLGYNHTIENSPIGVQSQIAKKMIQNLIVLDNFPSYLGFGRNERDEKGKKFAAEFSKLSLNTLASLESGVEIPEGKTPTVVFALNEILSMPLLEYSKEEAEIELKCVNFGHIISSSLGTPEGDS
jgi:hypothetical protein